MKILISDSLSKQGVELLEQSGFTVVVKSKMPKEELFKEIQDADGLIVRSGTKVTAELIAAAQKLKVVGRAGSGLDNVDTPAATRRGVVVMNTPGGNMVTTAEHTMAMIFSACRKIPQATASVKQGKWEKDKFMGIELYNKTLGIVGIGQIGGYLSRLAQGASMNVIAYDPYLAPERAEKMGVSLVELPELFRLADIVSVHTPLTPETKSLINAKVIETMKPGVVIVNCARGGIVDETDLCEALKTKRVAAAAFDVFEDEPVKADNPLLAMDNFICTPHIGAQTAEAQENVAIGIAEQIVDYFTRGVARGAVNIPSISPDLLPRLQPFLTLAERLGSLQMQLSQGGIERVTVEYSGEVAALSVAPLTIAVLKGLLSRIMEHPVNYVNAPTVAKERGIEVKEIKSSDAGDFISLIRVRVEAGKVSHQVAGTLYHKKEARVVEINQFKVEMVPEGHLLFIHNMDRPGVIGMVGQVLGDKGINIVRMQCALEKRGGDALLIIESDTEFPTEVLGHIKSSSNILSVKVASLS
ncbi:MAG: phosphoglycerate dehydrogenase [Nitrospira sp.]|nr:phosphoglycerate dehydrogenase [Nitrospira sp.]